MVMDPSVEHVSLVVEAAHRLDFGFDRILDLAAIIDAPEQRAVHQRGESAIP